MPLPTYLLIDSGSGTNEPIIFGFDAWDAAVDGEGRCLTVRAPNRAIFCASE